MRAHSFVAYDVALEINAELCAIVGRLENRELADQLKRAAISIALNVAEGNRREMKDRLQHFRIASGSAPEALAALDLALCWAELEEPAVRHARELLDRELALLRGLTRKR